jgi:hypothetical protein
VPVVERARALSGERGVRDRRVRRTVVVSARSKKKKKTWW